MIKPTKKTMKTERGIALLSVIVLLIVFLIFAGAVMTQLAQEVNSSKTNGVSVKALTAADAGVHAMVVAIEENISAGKPDPGTFTYNYPEPGASPSNTSYTVSIDRKWIGLAPAGNRFYLITSIGAVNNGIEHQTRRVRAIARAVSLAQYASFSNYESNQFGKTVWYTPSQYFDGQVYSGGPMHVEYDNTHFDYTKFLPIFGVTVQTVNKPVWLELQGGTPVDDSSDWSSVINGGSPNFGVGGTALGLPQPPKDVLVASEAFYGNCCSITNSYPPCPGLCMNSGDATKGNGPLTTGMYVEGNAVIGASNSGSQETFTIHSPSGAFADYKVVINFPSGPTTVTQTGNTNVGTYSGVPSGDNGPGTGNGAVFVNGDATLKLGSVIEGQYTIAVPDYGVDHHNIYLSGSGSILYTDRTKDELGLWANNVILNTNSSDIEIDASIIAGFPGEAGTSGGFYNIKCNPNNCGPSSQGVLNLFGGLAENMRGALGRYINSTQHTGFERRITYDQRLASNPPPFNPVTGEYSIIAWEDLGN